MPSDAVEKKPFATEFAIRIRLLRARFQLSRQELVSAIGGVCDEQIRKMENGNAIYLSLEALGGLIAFALSRSISLIWLFTGLGPMELPGAAGSNPQSAIRNPQSEGGLADPNGTTTRARQDGRLTGGDSDRV
jgi:hypothetical protein